jgi:hypothetical protein
MAGERSPSVRQRGRRAVSRGTSSIARVVLFIARAIAAVIVIAILLVVFEANRDNALVEFLIDAGRGLAGPFDVIFELDERKGEVALNWGLAAVVYLFVGRLIARLLLRA